MESAIDFATIPGLDPAPETASCSNLVPTRRVRCRVVSTACGLRSGRNSASSVRARRYGNSEPLFATVRSYSDVHRSGMISATGLSVRRQVTAHRHGVTHGARTSIVPNNDTDRRER
jgi:hypothetical protein